MRQIPLLSLSLLPPSSRQPWLVHKNVQETPKTDNGFINSLRLKKRDNTTLTSSSTLLPRINGTANVKLALKQSGVNQLSALGIKGSSVKIEIIDTGVDYTHPSLGGSFWSGLKIVGGHAYVDDEDKAVDCADPLTTHVSGIVGMKDPDDV